MGENYSKVALLSLIVLFSYCRQISAELFLPEDQPLRELILIFEKPNAKKIARELLAGEILRTNLIQGLR